MNEVELRFWEVFDHVTKRFRTVEDALLYYRKYRTKKKTKEKQHQGVSWFGGEYRFRTEGHWSDWQRID